MATEDIGQAVYKFAEDIIEASCKAAVTKTRPALNEELAAETVAKAKMNEMYLMMMAAARYEAAASIAVRTVIELALDTVADTAIAAANPGT